MRENNEGVAKISIADLFGILLKRWFIILLVAGIVGGATYAYLDSNYVEEYTSKSTIMVMNPEENLSASSSAYYYSLTITAVNDCEKLMTSRTVLYRVIDELDLDMTYNQLKNMITISNFADSHVIEVSVKSGDPVLAKQIVDLICKKGAAMIEDYIEFATAKVIDEGTLNNVPSNTVGIEVAMLFGFAAALIVFGIFVLSRMQDDRISTQEDVEQYLGLSVLGVIPYSDVKQSKKKGRRR